MNEGRVFFTPKGRFDARPGSRIVLGRRVWDKSIGCFATRKEAEDALREYARKHGGRRNA